MELLWKMFDELVFGFPSGDPMITQLCDDYGTILLYILGGLMVGTVALVWGLCEWSYYRLGVRLDREYEEWKHSPEGQAAKEYLEQFGIEQE